MPAQTPVPETRRSRDVFAVTTLTLASIGGLFVLGYLFYRTVWVVLTGN